MQSFSLGFVSSAPLMLAIGPIALLLIDRGMQHGARTAYPAALGVASADLVFATGAVVGGAALVTSIERFLVPAQTVAVLLLLALAAHLAWSTLRSPATEHGAPPVTTSPASAEGGGPRRAGHPGGLAARFFALTVVNPMTVVAFVSLVVAAGPAAAHIEWALGVAAASVVVHSLFVLTGAGLGAAMSATAAVAVRLLGAVSIALLAIRFAAEI